MVKRFFVSPILLLAAAAAPALENTGFETLDAKSGRPTRWACYVSEGQAVVSQDTACKRQGQASIRMDVEARSRCTSSQIVAVADSGSYDFSAWCRSELPPKGQAHIYVQWRRDDGSIVANDKASPAVSGTRDWTELTAHASRRADATQALLVLVVQCGGEQGGVVWFDDVSFGGTAVDAGPIVRNGGFEQGGEQPAHWRAAVYGEGFTLTRDGTAGHDGAACARLAAAPVHGDRSCFVQMTEAFRPQRGLRLCLWYRGEGVATGILRLRPVGGEKEYRTHHFRLALPRSEWTRAEEEISVPPRAREAGAVRAEIILYQRGEGVLNYDDVSLESLERFVPAFRKASSSSACPFRPEDGRVVLQNPPDFWWPAQLDIGSYTLQFSQGAEFAPGTVEEIAGLRYNVYSHSAVLAVGSWHWRVRYTDSAGQASQWTSSRTFTISPTATPFPVPSADALLGRIPRSHPRVYATAASLDMFRAPMAGERRGWFERFRTRCDAHLDVPVDREPSQEYADYRAGGLDTSKAQLGNKLRGVAGRATNRMRELAFCYLLSGDERYGRTAVERAVEMATWDPQGVTSYQNHDQVFRDITWKLATTYDWCHDLMEEEERTAVRAAVEIRGGVLFRDLAESTPITERPYDSHGITAYGFLGICSVALAHDSETADRWFRFVASTYPAVFPPWGGEEGGWCQGVAYWKWSAPFAWYFFDALKSATGFSLYDKAFCRNNGWFKIYMHPPWCDRHHFGDGNHGAPDLTDSSNMAHMAKVYGNPYYQWYASNVPHSYSGVTSYWWYDTDAPARPPVDLPQGRYFPDIGWAAMHSDVSDPDDVMIAFKSSPYGSFNHSHADQNHFVLYAYGEPLLIDSGYYDYYGSPHDRNWTRQTKAHNAVLVNGEGQAIFDLDAKGRITDHLTTSAFDYVCGDATPAYKGALLRAKRHVFYLRPDVFLVCDDLEAPAAAEYTWCLHAEREMELRLDRRQIVVARGEAKCLVTFLGQDGLDFRQDDLFTPPPPGDRAKEWHAYATTTAKRVVQRFAVLVQPYRADAPEPRVDVTRQDEAAWSVGTDGPSGVWEMSLSLEQGEPVFAASLDGRPVVRYENGRVEDSRDRAPSPASLDLNLLLDGVAASFEQASTVGGRTLAWGCLPQAEQGLYRVVCGDDTSSTLRISRTTPVGGDLLWLTGGEPFSVRTAATALSVQLNRIPLCPETSAATIVDEDVAGGAGVLKVEAEAFAESSGSGVRAYSHRTFLSGGKGLDLGVNSGTRVTWRVDVPRAGRFRLVLKAAVFEENAVRLYTLDDAPLGGRWERSICPNTGGFGATPDQWKHIQLADAKGRPLVLDVTAGTHRLSQHVLERKMNLDYLLLVPAE